MNTKRLTELASRLRSRNKLDAQIAKIIGRPAQTGHIGEFVAAELFSIRLHDSANEAGSDGVFESGPHKGRTVNIKWYAKREGIMDLAVKSKPQTYLVLAGPAAGATSSAGTHRPLVIESVYLFDAADLHADLTGRELQIGQASSVLSRLWDAAQVWPVENPAVLPLDDNQRAILSSFGSRC
jgi:hypothetical protein